MIKVWDWSRSDRHGNPTLARVSRAVPSHMRPTPATALAVTDTKVKDFNYYIAFGSVHNIYDKQWVFTNLCDKSALSKLI